MKFLQYVYFFYLILAVLFLYDGISKLNAPGTGTPVISFLFAAAAVFMFFFRRRHARKFQQRDK